MTWLGTGHVFGLNWQDMGHLYAALVGFSIGVWIVTVAAFIREIRSLYVDGKRSWRLPLGLSCWVAALGLYSGAVATALTNPKSDIPVWRLSIYWTALVLADLGVGMWSWHIHRHGVNPDVRSSLPGTERRRRPKRAKGTSTMNRLQSLIDRYLNDEKDEPFDYEPADQAAVEPDKYTTPDVGDADSAVKS